MRAIGLAFTIACAVLAVSPPAAADKRITAAGVTLEPPTGWKLTKQPDGSATFVNAQGDIVWRIFPNESTTDFTAWFKAAWRAITSAHTNVNASPADESPTNAGLQGRVAAGVMTDASGAPHLLLLAAVADGKRVAPMLIEFANEDSLSRYVELSPASESIKLVPGRSKPKSAFANGGWRYPNGNAAPVAKPTVADGPPPPIASAPTPAPASAPTPAPANAANLPFLGKWAAGHSVSSSDYSVSYGSRAHQYDFATDGTYRYHSEAWGGTFGSNWRYIIDEKGTWTASGDQLTISPTSVKGVVRDLAGNVQKQHDQSPPPIEKVTYRFQTTYFSGIQETQLVLTPAKPTRRDGAFANNASFPKSYLLRSNYTTGFRFPAN